MASRLFVGRRRAVWKNIETEESRAARINFCIDRINRLRALHRLSQEFLSDLTGPTGRRISQRPSDRRRGSRAHSICQRRATGCGHQPRWAGRADAHCGTEHSPTLRDGHSAYSGTDADTGAIPLAVCLGDAPSHTT
jgi:hypothetical protein